MSHTIMAGMRVRIHRFLAGLELPTEDDLELDVDLDADTTGALALRPLQPQPGDTFDARVTRIYGDHPTNPTRYELCVVREDTGEDVRCPLSAVMCVLPGLPTLVREHRSSKLTESGRFRAKLIDSICGPVLETVVDDPEFLTVPDPNLYVRIRTKYPAGPDELPVDLS